MTDQIDDGVAELDEQAREIIEHRSEMLFRGVLQPEDIRRNEEDKNLDGESRGDRLKKYSQQDQAVAGEIRKKGIAVYEDAIKRRGARQAALDVMQNAVGLPLDAAKRQAEIERRETENHAAALAQSGQGTVSDNVENATYGGIVSGLDQRVDEHFGDPATAEGNPHIQQGHGANVAAQVAAVDQLQAIEPGADLTQANVIAASTGEGDISTNSTDGKREAVEDIRQQQRLDSVSQRPDLAPDGKTPTDQVYAPETGDAPPQETDLAKQERERREKDHTDRVATGDTPQ